MKLQLSALALSLIILCNATVEVTERPCNLAFRCSSQEDLVWASNGKKCYVFRNACHLASENCQRQNRYEPVLEVVCKDKCQDLCNPICNKIMKPVCGVYNDEKREFANKCLMDYCICSTGKTYMIYNEGPCEES